MLPECLARLEGDQDGARAWVGAEDDGRAAASGRLDLAEVPALHATILSDKPIAKDGRAAKPHGLLVGIASDALDSNAL
jgi:hypothetical protein